MSGIYSRFGRQPYNTIKNNPIGSISQKRSYTIPILVLLCLCITICIILSLSSSVAAVFFKDSITDLIGSESNTSVETFSPLSCTLKNNHNACLLKNNKHIPLTDSENGIKDPVFNYNHDYSYDIRHYPYYDYNYSFTRN